MTVTLRDADIGDAERLREWRNDPTAVATSLTGRRVEADEHASWLEALLDNPGRRLWVVQLDGEPAGSLRLDKMDDGRVEVSIALDTAVRGRGVGRTALGLAAVACPWPGEVLARVRADNVPSLRAFAAAGYERRGEQDGVVELALRRAT